MTLRTRGEKIFDGFNVFFMILMCLVMIYPFLNQLAFSFSSSQAVMTGKVSLWPVEFTTKAYHEVLSDKRFLTSFFNSIRFTIFGTIMQMAVMTTFAFPISQKALKGRGAIMNIMIFSMIFGTGGLIPNYLLMKSLNLINTFWALWFPGMFGIWNIIILKNFFAQLPDSLIESAEIDGARPFKIFIRIILPLSLPSVATISLFTAVNLWNTFFSAMIYLSKPDVKLLQVHLNEILQNYIQSVSSDGLELDINSNAIASESIKAATIICTAVPIICVYPFVQRYFVKGVMVGAIKG